MKITKENFSLDIAIIALSIVVAVIMVRTDFFGDFLLRTSSFQIIGSIIAGFFFTSVFTTAPAIVTIGEIAKNSSILETAIFGAIGALLGDLIIFKFIRDRLSDHFIEVMKHEKWWRKVKVVLKLKYFRWITFLLGGIILASPFPDELAVTILGFVKMKTRQFIPISFLFNFIGILCIGLIARAV